MVSLPDGERDVSRSFFASWMLHPQTRTTTPELSRLFYSRARWPSTTGQQTELVGQVLIWTNTSTILYSFIEEMYNCEICLSQWTRFVCFLSYLGSITTMCGRLERRQQKLQWKTVSQSIDQVLSSYNWILYEIRGWSNIAKSQWCWSVG